MGIGKGILFIMSAREPGETANGVLIGSDRLRQFPLAMERSSPDVVFVSDHSEMMEGSGVVPDKIVSPAIAGLQRGRDEILEEAERMFKSP